MRPTPLVFLAFFALSVSSLAGASRDIVGRLSDVFLDDVDSEFLHLTIQTPTGITYTCFHSACIGTDFQHLKDLLGCEIRLTGKETPITKGRVLLGSSYSLRSVADITVLSRPQKDPFDMPTLTESPPKLNEIDSCGPRKARGVVIARWHGDSFLLRTADGQALKVQLRDRHLPPIGASVETTGTIVTDLYRYGFVQAQWRGCEPVETKPGKPENLPLSRLFSMVGRSIISHSFHGQVIRTRGTAKAILSDESGPNRLLIEDAGSEIIVDCSALPEALNPVRTGCRVEVSCICVMESDNWHPGTIFPKVSGLFLVPQAATDIVILRQPPWWTPARLLAVVLGLLVLLAAILVWNATLRALVARKSRALLREQAEKLAETLKIDERTRLAAELHDYLAQNLSVISCQISAAKSAFRLASNETGPLLDTADKMVQSCCTDLRRCLWDLRNDALNEPDLDKAIVRTAAPVAGDVKLVTRFPVRRSLLTDSTAHTILSIIRELVSNAVRHGHAKSVHVAGELRDGTIRFSVRDDGVGFDPTSRPGQAEGHFGLDGVKERIKHMNGRLDIDSTPEKGTRVVVTLKARSAE